MSLLHRLSVLPVVLLPLPACGDAYPTVPITEAGTFQREIEVDGRTRTYEVQVPDSWDGVSPLPVLVGFHGVPRLYGLAALTDLDEQARDAGVVLVLPDAHAGSGDWDLGCAFCTSASRKGIDDLEFLARVLDRVEPLPDAADDGTRVERRSYPGCANGGDLVLYAVLGGGHTWPGSPYDFSDALGARTDDISASARILDLVRTGRP